MLAGKRKDNSAYITEEKYADRVEEVKEAEKNRRPGKDYRRLKKYATVKVRGEYWLIIPLKNNDVVKRFHVPTEELFDRIGEVHVTSGHAGKNKMIPLLKQKYANVTQVQS